MGPEIPSLDRRLFRRYMVANGVAAAYILVALNRRAFVVQ